MKNILVLLLVVVTNVGTFSCKKALTNKQKTLENLANGQDLITNVCKGDPKDLKEKEPYLNDIKILVDSDDPQKKKEFLSEIGVALTALPNAYLGALSSKGLDVKFVVTPLTDERCRGGLTNAGLEGQTITSCVTAIRPGILMGEGSEFEGIGIYIAPNKSIVRHSIVRLVGLLFSQILGRNATALKLDGKFKSDDFYCEGSRDDFGLLR